MTKGELVSIIISTYNGTKTLNDCLSSVSQQTYSNWQLICINDASTDQTSQILQHWQQKVGKEKLTIITNPQNLGLTKSLNKAASKAKGSLLARIDADDTWHPTKLQQQIKFLQNHPSIGVLGTWYQNTHNNHQHLIKTPTDHNHIKKTIFRRNPFGHSTVIIKKSLFDQVGGYNPSLRFAQDKDLWFRLFPHTNFANIPHALVTRQTNPTTSTTNKRQQIIQSLKITHQYIRQYHANPTNYLYMIEPLISLITPTWIRSAYRQIR